VQVVYPSGRVVDYSRDSLGRITDITTREVAASPAVDVATGIAYEPFGPVASLTYGNGLGLSFAYDQDYRLTAITVDDGVGELQDLAYGYDANDNVTTLTGASPRRGAKASITTTWSA